MNAQSQYERWLLRELEDKDLTSELEAVKGNEKEIEDRFYRDLEFGTGGLRGVIGAGTNRMNIYTVRRATQGLCNYLNREYQAPSVAVAHDSRIKSDLFARESVKVFAANGVRVFFYSELTPTPMLSFAVRECGCQAGVVLTASHNPSKYNGYKAYGPDGCQLTLDAAAQVLSEIEKVDPFDDVQCMPFDEALEKKIVQYVPDEVIERYFECVLNEAIRPEAAKKAGLSVAYTPLNGTGNKPVRCILKRMGIDRVAVVPEQEQPDGNFPTCPFPNPEIKEALQLAIELAKKEHSDLVLATDPDADRVGIAVLHQGDYHLLTGNEVGVLLTEYIAKGRLEKGTMPKDPIVVKTVVTTKMVEQVAADYGLQVVDVLTGFKFIGEQISLLEQKGERERYIFGFEESYGYLSGGYVRDKDAMNGAMLICEMASYYKLQGQTLVDALTELYERYGFVINRQVSFVCEGMEGMARMEKIMDTLRRGLSSLGSRKVISAADYLASLRKTAEGKAEKILLPKSNVLEFTLEEGASVVIRPSGTEPKIKVYYSVKGKDETQAERTLEEIAKDLTARMGF